MTHKRHQHINKQFVKTMTEANYDSILDNPTTTVFLLWKRIWEKKCFLILCADEGRVWAFFSFIFGERFMRWNESKQVYFVTMQELRKGLLDSLCSRSYSDTESCLIAKIVPQRGIPYRAIQLNWKFMFFFLRPLCFPKKQYSNLWFW